MSSEQSFETGDSQPERWTTVQRKCPGRRAPRENSGGRHATSNLSQEQENLVKLAETQLSKTDRKKIEARECVLNLRKTRAKSAEPRGGPSKDKGKAPDPKDWGGIDLQDEELDLEAQREAFESYHIAREQASNLQEHQSEQSDSGTQRDPERTEEIASETLGRSTGSN